MRKKGSLSILMAIVAVSAACSQQQIPSKATDGPDEANEKAEVIFYSSNNDPVESFDYRFGDSLRKKFPNYTIRYIQSEKGFTLPEMVAAGTRFDIFFHSIGNFEGNAFPNGIESDMTDLIEKHEVNLNRFEPTIIEAVRQASGGKMYGLPVFTNNLVLYYNKSLFDRFGVPYPKDGMTWEETMEFAKKLTRNEGGVQYYGFTHSPAHTIRMNPLSIPNADLKNDTPTINKDEKWKLFFETLFVDPMRMLGYLEAMKKTNRLPDINSFVKDKNVAMYAYLSSLIYVWADQMKDVEWDIVSLPTFKDQKGIGSQSYPSYFGITKMAQNRDAAMKVLKHMVSEEFQTELSKKGIMPVLSDTTIQNRLGEESPYKDRHFAAVFYNKFAPIPNKGLYDLQLVSAYTSAGTNIALDKMDMNTSLRTAEQDAQKQIDIYKQQMSGK